MRDRQESFSGRVSVHIGKIVLRGMDISAEEEGRFQQMVQTEVIRALGGAWKLPSRSYRVQKPRTTRIDLRGVKGIPGTASETARAILSAIRASEGNAGNEV